MGEKDITEKVLENFNDVFADIINVLIFDGEEVIKPEQLLNAVARADYKEANKTREMERDVEKFWEKGGIRFAVYGIENQTKPIKDMPIRMIGYDGISYRQQMDQDDAYRGQRYPVISLVLYYGHKQRWSQPKSLSELLPDMDERLKPFFHDYAINLFEIAYLEDETVSKFKSDFRFVADFFVQRRKTGNYKPLPDKVKHLSQLCRLLSVMTSDDSFENAYLSLQDKGESNMCDVVDKIVESGRIEGREGTALNMLRRLIKRQQPIDSQSIADIAEDAELSVDRVRELAQDNGLALQ